MVYQWVHSVGSHLVVTVRNARRMSMSTFWVLTYLVEDVGRHQPLCTHYRRLCGYSLLVVSSSRTFFIPGSLLGYCAYLLGLRSIRLNPSAARDEIVSSGIVLTVGRVSLQRS